MLRFWLATSMALIAASCAPVPFKSAAFGKYEGHATVVWVGSGSPSLVGDGEFLYVPIPGQELRFTRADGQVFQPEAFYTDGGSIPRLVQGFNGLNAWGFGPAYIIHDWLFVARKCLNDKDDQVVIDQNLLTDEMRKIQDIKFRDSAVIMAELIRTLAADEGEDDSAGALISNTTAGPISRNLWQAKGKCAENAVTQEDKQIIADITRSEQRRLRVQRFSRGARSDPESVYRTRRGKSYVVVGRYVFD